MFLYSKKPLEISLGIYKDGCIAILLHKLTHEVEPMMVVYSCIGKTHTSLNVVFIWENADKKTTQQMQGIPYSYLSGRGSRPKLLPHTCKGNFLEEAHDFLSFYFALHRACPPSLNMQAEAFTSREKRLREIKGRRCDGCGFGKGRTAGK